jgi:hypothetical protein
MNQKLSATPAALLMTQKAHNKRATKSLKYCNEVRLNNIMMSVKV